MPAGDYNFRPNADEMNFRQVMAPIALGNLGAYTRARGMQRPALPERIEAWSKELSKIYVDRDIADV